MDAKSKALQSSSSSWSSAASESSPITSSSWPSPTLEVEKEKEPLPDIGIQLKAVDLLTERKHEAETFDQVLSPGPQETILQLALKAVHQSSSQEVTKRNKFLQPNLSEDKFEPSTFTASQSVSVTLSPSQLPGNTGTDQNASLNCTDEVILNPESQPEPVEGKFFVNGFAV